MSSDLEKLIDETIAQTEDPAEQQSIKAVVSGKDKLDIPSQLLGADSNENDKSLYTLIGEMKMPEKIKLALFGNSTARSILIRDANKQINLFVLQNNRLTENEIVEYARNTNLNQAVFREISNRSEWMKNYQVKLSIVSNPKVPIDVSLKWIRYLQDGDLRKLSKSKNVPSVVATQCRRVVEGKGF